MVFNGIMRAASLAGAASIIAIAAHGSALAGADGPWEVEVWDPPFDMESPRTTVMYEPLAEASEPWEICVSFPHMKDPYWLAVNYGAADQAEHLGVKMQLVEAGGYTELAKQISQVEDCVAAGADAVVLGAISADGLNNLISELKAKDIPVIDVINGVSSPDITAKALVSFGELGEIAGNFLAERHPEGSEPVQVGWFPGPAGAGWAEAADTQFKKAVEGTAVEIVDTKWGDNGKEIQLGLVEDVLQAYDGVDYVIGTTVTAEAAAGYLRREGLADQVKVMPYFYAVGVHRGIGRGDILGAPTDKAVIQARIAMDQAVRALEGKEFIKHAGPKLEMIDSETIKTFDRGTSLAPDDFSPTFTVNY